MHGGAYTTGDHDVHGHSRADGDVVTQLRQFFFGHQDAGNIVGATGLLVAEGICRDALDLADNLRRGPPTERRKPQPGILAGVDVVHVSGPDPAFHHEPVLTRHNVHNGAAGGDHPTQSVDAEADDLAILGRHDDGTLQHVAHRGDTLAGLEPLLLHRVDLVGNLRPPATFNLENLLASLADSDTGRGNIGDDTADLADVLLIFTLPGDQHALINQLLVAQGKQAFQILLDQLLLAHQGPPARFQAVNLLIELADSMAQDLDLSVVLAPPHLEQVLLHGQNIRDNRVVTPFQQFVGKADRLFQQALGIQPVNLRQAAVIATLQQFQLGAGLGFTQFNQDVPGLHHAALMHVQVLHNAALQVLDGFVVGIHHHRTRRNHAFGQRRQRSPGDKSTQGDDDHDDPPAHHHVAGQ